MSDKVPDEFPVAHSKILSVQQKRYRVYSETELPQPKSRIPNVSVRREYSSPSPACEEESIEPVPSEVSSSSVSAAMDADVDVDTPSDEDEGPFRVPFFVHSQHRGKVIGRGGSTLRKISRECGVKIHVPGRGDPSNFVEIDAPDSEALQRAKDAIVGCLPSWTPKTHFFSVRFSQAPLFKSLQDTLLSEFPQSLDRSFFISEAKFHFTLAVMTLKSRDAEERVKAAMNGRIAEYVGEMFGVGSGTELKIEFEGLSVFPEKSPRRANVVHLRPKETDSCRKLRALAEFLRVVLMEESLDDGDPDEFGVKLHATVANAKYGRRKGAKIDAMSILAQYGSSLPVRWVGKKFAFRNLELSMMQTSTPKAYYDCAHQIPFQ